MNELLICILAAAFFIAGVVNIVGTRATRNDFERWGYASWWGKMTGILEVSCALMLIFPLSFLTGFTLGSVIILAALGTVLRFNDFRHLPPIAIYVMLLIAVWLVR